jgi:integrase
MAIIEKRGDLQWRARVRKKGYPDQSKTFMLKADAERWARETEVEMERGTWRDGKLADESFGEYAEKYLRDVTPTKRSPVNEAHRITTLLAAPEFRKPLGQIRAVDVATYRDRRLAEPVRKTPKKSTQVPGKSGGDDAVEQAKPRRRRAASSVPAVRTLSPQTVLHELNTLSAIFVHCIKEWSVPLQFNPVRNINLPRPSRPLERRVSELELEWLLRAAAGTYAVPQIITLAVETSMRLGELLGLLWKHVDVDRCTAHLPVTKNGYSRTVALSPKAVEALNELKPKKKTAGNLAAVADSQENSAPSSFARKQAVADKQGRVFHWARTDSFEKTWARCRTNARALYLADCETLKVQPEDDFLVGVRFHTLRHEATSRLFEKGLGLSDVALMTGHRSAQMLMRYTHPDAEKLAERLAKLA